MTLLIHSLTEFSELLFSVFEAGSVRTIVEVGSESGGFTLQMLDWLRERNGHLTTIDPKPDPRVHSFPDEWPGTHTLITQRSPEALWGLPKADAYVLDGDHNYWTVSEELRAIRRSSELPESLIILHDVCWPCGRRDAYYSPEAIPVGARQPYAFDRGVVLENPDTVNGGFRGEGVFAWALYEGGSQNGVLTAVEDFVAAEPGYELVIIPAVFGLGILVPDTHPNRSALLTILEPLHLNPLLQRLETNRLRNYLRVIELQDQMAGDS
jgi:hypothetical protein